MNKFMRSSADHNQHHNVYNMFKLQSFSAKWLFVVDAVVIHAKFGTLFVHISPNSTHQTGFLSNHT
jgi:hypothetical protein